MTPTAEDLAFALAALDEGVTVFPHDDNGRFTGLWLVDLLSVVLYCKRVGIEYEQPYTDRMKSGYPTPILALATAGRVLGLKPKWVVVPVEVAKVLLDATRGAVSVNDTMVRNLRNNHLDGAANLVERVAERYRKAEEALADALSSTPLKDGESS